MNLQSSSSGRPLHLAAWALLFVVLAAAYSPVLQNGFVWDDRPNLVENDGFRGVGWPQIRWDFTAFHIGHYQPLTWLSFGVDYLIWGMRPIGYHLTNLLLHLVDTVLFAMVARRLIQAAWVVPGAPQIADYKSTSGAAHSANWAALAAAAMFALHPLRVESVAWASERRDMLCAAFFLLSVLCYLRAVGRRIDTGLHRGLYAMSLGCFIISLFCKTLGMSLPIVLLVLDIYPLRRHHSSAGRPAASWGRLILEKLPFLFVSIVMGLVSLAAQSAAGALVPLHGHGAAERLAQATYGAVFYLCATFAKFNWYALYERPYALNPVEPRFLACEVMFVTLTATALLLRRRWPSLSAAWICYLALVGPVLGVAQSGFQLVADRYSYLSCMAWAILSGSALVRWVHRQAASSASRRAITAAAIGLLAGWAGLTWRQTRFWHDDVTLWSHVLDGGPSAMASNNLGHLALDRQDTATAARHFTAALIAKPTYDKPMSNFMRLLFDDSNSLDRKDAEAALPAVQRAVRLAPDSSTGQFVLGSLLARLDRPADAAEALERCVALEPDLGQAWFKLALARYAQQKLPAAMQAVERAVSIEPRHGEAWLTLALIRMESGQLADALGAFEQSAKLRPATPLTWTAWGACLYQLGRGDDAVSKLERALELDPQNPRARSILAAINSRRSVPATSQAGG